jgi:hypothetical protein
MALNSSIGASFDNMYGWKRIREKAGEFNSTEDYMTNDKRLLVGFSTVVTLV